LLIVIKFALVDNVIDLFHLVGRQKLLQVALVAAAILKCQLVEVVDKENKSMGESAG
jgi:hypothetical protein